MRPLPRVTVFNRHLRHLRHRPRFLNELRVTHSVFQSSPAGHSSVTSQRVFEFADLLVSSTPAGDGSGDARVTFNPDDASPLNPPVYSGFFGVRHSG